VVQGPETPACAIQSGCLRKVQVLDADNGEGSLRDCIFSEHGKYYEIDSQKLAKSITGEVRKGYLLKEQLEGDVFTRAEAVVIKMMSSRKIDFLKRIGHKENPMREIYILQMIGLSNPHLLGQVDCVRVDDQIMSIMPYKGEELFSVLKKKSSFSSSEVQRLFRQIVEGVASMQALSLCHRDLSLENIVVNDMGECTIIDFGMAIIVPKASKSTIKSIMKSLEEEQQQSKQQSKTAQQRNSEDEGTDCEDDSFEDSEEHLLMAPQGPCGKENYIAPEILTNCDPFDGLVVDNWALGVILFMLFAGRPPFMRATHADRWFRQVQQNKLCDLLKKWKIDNIPVGAVDLMEKLLKAISPKERYSTADVLGHYWMQSEGSINMHSTQLIEETKNETLKV